MTTETKAFSRWKTSRVRRSPGKRDVPAPPKPLYLLLAVVAQVLLLGVIVYLWRDPSPLLLSVAFVALLAGLVAESKRLIESWFSILLISIGASACSLIGLSESPPVVTLWGVVFILAFAGLACWVAGRKATTPIHEGNTLLLSIALAYWMADYGFLHTASKFNAFLLLGAASFVLFSLYHAFSTETHSPVSKFFLSLWSSVILLIFSIQNLTSIRVEDYERTDAGFDDIVLTVVRFFLLGISSIYIVRNCYLVIGFLPSKADDRDSYRERVRDVKDEHVGRFTDYQIQISEAMLAISLSAVVYLINLQFSLLRASEAIWLVVVLYPAGAYFLKRVRKPK